MVHLLNMFAERGVAMSRLSDVNPQGNPHEVVFQGRKCSLINAKDLHMYIVRRHLTEPIFFTWRWQSMQILRSLLRKHPVSCVWMYTMGASNGKRRI